MELGGGIASLPPRAWDIFHSLLPAGAAPTMACCSKSWRTVATPTNPLTQLEDGEAVALAEACAKAAGARTAVAVGTWLGVQHEAVLKKLKDEAAEAATLLQADDAEARKATLAAAEARVAAARLELEQAGGQLAGARGMAERAKAAVNALAAEGEQLRAEIEARQQRLLGVKAQHRTAAVAAEARAAAHAEASALNAAAERGEAEAEAARERSSASVDELGEAQKRQPELVVALVRPLPATHY
jgi:ParB family chromosome partitioning protein